MAGISVNDAYIILKDVGVLWVAGKNGGEQFIKSVTIIEKPDDFKWLQGGEMILATLQEGIMNFFIKAQERHAVCAGIRLHNDRFSNIPEEVRMLADSLNFPLFVINKNVPNSMILKKLYSAILSHEKLALEKYREIILSTNEFLFSHTEADKILERLARIINNSIVLLDENFRQVSSVLNMGKYADLISNKQNELCELIKRYVEICGYFGLNKKAGEVNFLSLNERILVVFSFIPLKMLERNYVIFTAVDKGITQDEIELYKIAFSSAAMALGNYGVGNEEAAGRGKLRESLNYELFCKLLNHTDDFGELLVNRFEKTGFNLLDRNFIAIFEIKFDDSCKTLNKNERNNNDVKKKLNNIFRKNLKDRSSLLVPKDNEWVLLIGFSEDECAKDVLYKKAFQEIFDHLIVEINNMNLNTSLSAGVSSSTKNIAGIKKAYMEAGIAKEIGKRVRSGENIFFYEDLGIYKFLSIPDKDEILKDKRIRSIYEYDKKNNASLIDTLDAFMDTNGRIKDTAKKIFTHPNTVKYRLNKIKELAGEEILKNDNKRLYYHIMVKALKLILKKA